MAKKNDNPTTNDTPAAADARVFTFRANSKRRLKLAVILGSRRIVFDQGITEIAGKKVRGGAFSTDDAKLAGQLRKHAQFGQAFHEETN